jgi:Icc-related predicted phosphoesterase
MPAPLRVAALGDIHYTRHSKGKRQGLFGEISAIADVALLCGDLTDFGLPEEAALLAEDIQSHLKIPTLAVVGNHDFESGHISEVIKILDNAGVEMFDDESIVIEGVGFAGVCGFGGGFGSRMLNAWGEPIIKAFVQEAVDHGLRLEKALSRLNTEKKVVCLHYAPIRDTVIGESEEVFPFLGSSRLEGPLNRFSVTAVVHGHAHNGTFQGATSTGIPVYNVALPLLEKLKPGGRSFLLLEV